MRLFHTRSARIEKSAPPISFHGKEVHSSLFASPNVRGRIDGIAGDEIRGWIVDESEPNRCLRLCLLMDGIVIEKTSTCVFRKDLEQRFGSRGLHGFCFRIPDTWSNKTELAVEIRLEDGRRLCNASVFPNSAAGESETPAQREACLLLMHIPKTAVTAIRSALRSDWLTDRQIWMYGEAPGFPPEHISHLTESQLRRVECIIGHVPFGFHALVPQLVMYATILRDPVERCISHYFQDRFKSGNLDAPARRMSLDEMLASPTLPFGYDNLMVRMITGMGPEPVGSVNRDLLRQAIENIHRHFCYVGLQQHTGEAVASLAQYLNLQPNPLQIENVGLYDKNAAASASIRRRLRDLNRFDLELFKYVQDRFWFSGANGWVDGFSARNIAARASIA